LLKLGLCEEVFVDDDSLDKMYEGVEAEKIRDVRLDSFLPG